MPRDMRKVQKEIQKTMKDAMADGIITDEEQAAIFELLGELKAVVLEDDKVTQKELQYVAKIYDKAMKIMTKGAK